MAFIDFDSFGSALHVDASVFVLYFGSPIQLAVEKFSNPYVCLYIDSARLK